MFFFPERPTKLASLTVSNHLKVLQLMASIKAATSYLRSHPFSNQLLYSAVSLTGILRWRISQSPAAESRRDWRD